MLRQIFFIWLGPQIMVTVQYLKFFVTGYMVLDPITGITGIVACILQVTNTLVG